MPSHLSQHMISSACDFVSHIQKTRHPLRVATPRAATSLRPKKCVPIHRHAISFICVQAIVRGSHPSVTLPALPVPPLTVRQRSLVLGRAEEVAAEVASEVAAAVVSAAASAARGHGGVRGASGPATSSAAHEVASAPDAVNATTASAADEIGDATSCPRLGRGRGRRGRSARLRIARAGLSCRISRAARHRGGRGCVARPRSVRGRSSRQALRAARQSGAAVLRTTDRGRPSRHVA